MENILNDHQNYFVNWLIIKLILDSDNFNDVSIITPSKIIDYSIQTPYDSAIKPKPGQLAIESK